MKEKKNETEKTDEIKNKIAESNPFYENADDVPDTVVKDNVAEQPSENSVSDKGDSESLSESAEIARLKEENQRLSRQLEDLNSQYLRLAADFDNFRKRQAQEKQELFKVIISDVVKNFLPTLDSLDKAYVTFKELDDVEKLKESFNVLYRQMQESMSKIKVVKIKTAGEIFDPNYHEAVMQEETTEHEDGAIIMELQPGYMVDDRVIRASMVKVASNPEGSSSKKDKKTPD